MPSVDLVHVSGLFFESNLLGIEGNNDPKYFGKEPWKFRGFKMRIKEEKLKRLFVGPWGTATTIAPHDNLCP